MATSDPQLNVDDTVDLTQEDVDSTGLYSTHSHASYYSSDNMAVKPNEKICNDGMS